MTSIFDISSSAFNINQINGDEIIPEPVFLFTIEPILSKGDPSEAGKSLNIYLDGEATPVDSIQIQISETEQITSLSYQNINIDTLDNIYITDFKCSNFLFEGEPGALINLTVTNINPASDGYDLSSPLIDLFREGDILRISMGVENLLTSTSNVDLFIGSINNIDINYGNNGLNITLRVENLLNILARSAAVQTSDAEILDQQFINPISASLYNFDNLLNSLLNETIISEAITSQNATPQIFYYRGVTDGVPELEAVGREGSAISPNSDIYVFTPPTESKLNVILQTLYAYQRIFYIDNNGDFIITPLQNYFNEESNWRLGMNNAGDLIQCENINIAKNTSNIQNRTYVSILQIFQQFEYTNATGSDNKSNAYSVATTNSDYFPRVRDFVDSGKYLQTMFGTQEINENIVQNAGLLNIAENFGAIEGLKTIINVDGNQGYITSNSELDPIKYFTSLYAARSLSEQLFNDTHVVATMPTNLTFNPNLGTFRPIPLNELVYMPPVTNNVFDGISQYFCYGYELSYSRGNSANTTLFLTKPFTYTAFWCDNTELIG